MLPAPADYGILDFGREHAWDLGCGTGLYVPQEDFAREPQEVIDQLYAAHLLHFRVRHPDGSRCYPEGERPRFEPLAKRVLADLVVWEKTCPSGP